MFENIKIIIFDIDNTLLDFKKNAELSMRKTFSKWEINYKNEYLPLFLTINDKYWSRYEDEEITRDYLYKHRWQEIFDILGINIPGAEFEQDFIKELYHSSEKVEGAQELLEYLKDKYPLYIASNSSLDEQSTRLAGAGLINYFKKIYTSEDLGVSKPNPKFYDQIYQDFPEIKKEEILFIGDSIKADIEGSHNYGFRTAWFNPNHLNEKTDADLEFYSLDELKSILTVQEDCFFKPFSG